MELLIAVLSMHADTNTTRYFDSKVGYRISLKIFIYQFDSFLLEYLSIKSFSVRVVFTHLYQLVGLVANRVFQPSIDQSVAVCTPCILYLAIAVIARKI